MKQYEKQTFIRFVSIYLLISFALFSSLAFLYYMDKKRDMENQLAVETSRYAQEYRDFGDADLPKGFQVGLENKGKLPYPAFIKDQGVYKNTSCAGSLGQGQMIVVSVTPKVLSDRLKQLQIKILIGMSILFVINFLIGFILGYFALKPVKKANNDFLEFVDDVIHDLNAPVSALSINAESLAQECANKKIQRILRSLESIQNIYKNLSIILLERNKPVYEVVALDAMVKQIIEQLHSIYPQVKFELFIPNVSIKVNPVAFERILTNLIENSVKYTMDEPIIKIGLNKGKRFYIQDNGVGFEEGEFLQERNMQSKRTNKGYGLGLSIVQRLSKECGIEFFIKSKKGEGSTFYFDLHSVIEGKLNG